VDFLYFCAFLILAGALLYAAALLDTDEEPDLRRPNDPTNSQDDTWHD
jgi:hypothetical protein